MEDRLDKLEDKLDRIYENQIQIREAIAELKVKSGIWGIIGGCLVSIPVLIMFFIRGK